jgi:hypothetical protein
VEVATFEQSCEQLQRKADAASPLREHNKLSLGSGNVAIPQQPSALHQVLLQNRCHLAHSQFADE